MENDADMMNNDEAALRDSVIVSDSMEDVKDRYTTRGDFAATDHNVPDEKKQHIAYIKGENANITEMEAGCEGNPIVLDDLEDSYVELEEKLPEGLAQSDHIISDKKGERVLEIKDEEVIDSIEHPQT